MSRFVLGNCIDVMARIPDNAIDFILTDPPYLVGFRDRSGRTIAGDKTDEWLQPACNEMFRVLKKRRVNGELLRLEPRRSLYGRPGKMRDSALLVTLVFTKNYTSKAAYVGYRHECAYIPGKRPSTSATKPAAGRAGLEIFGQSPSPDGKARYQPATAD